MLRYRAEIFVAADRYVCLKLPDAFPEGTAFVTVDISPDGMDERPGDPTPTPSVDPARDDDIEWWDELGEDAPGH